MGIIDALRIVRLFVASGNWCDRCKEGAQTLTVHSVIVKTDLVGMRILWKIVAVFLK
jgi:hypothetical protein